MTRSFAEWDAHPQGRAVARLPIFTIEKIGDAPPQPLPPGDRPLVGRARARSHARDRGAGVRTHARRAWRGRAAGHRRAPAADDAAGDGQRARQALDLHRSARGARARDAGRACARRRHFRAGLSARRRRAATASAPKRWRGCGPGIVYVSLCAYGHEGPWADAARLRLAGAERERHQSRRGRSGGQRAAKTPALPGDRPCERLPDGVRRDDGARAARDRRRKLARARVARADRPLDPRARARSTGLARPIPASTTCATGWRRTSSGFGRLTAVRHAATMSETPPRWARPSVPLGTHEPRWP